MKSTGRLVIKVWNSLEENIAYGNIELMDRSLEFLLSYIFDDSMGNMQAHTHFLRRVMIYNCLNNNTFANLIICDNLIRSILLNQPTRKEFSIIEELELFIHGNMHESIKTLSNQ